MGCEVASCQAAQLSLAATWSQITSASDSFGPSGTETCLPVGGEDLRRVVGGAEGQAVPDPVDHQQVTALGGELGAAVADRIVGLGGEADDDLARPPPLRGQLAKNVRILRQLDRLSGPAAFLSLVSLLVTGR